MKTEREIAGMSRRHRSWKPCTRSWIIVLALTTMALLAVAGPAVAGTIADQSFFAGSASVSGEAGFAQTFRAGVSGTIVRLQLRLFGDVDLTVDFRRTDEFGIPLTSDDLADQLARFVITPPGDAFRIIDMSIFPPSAPLRKDDVIAIVIRADGIINWGIGTGEDATYERGAAFLRAGDRWRRFEQDFPLLGRGDFHFGTFVETAPTPSTAPMAAMALASWAGLRLRGMRRIASTARRTR